MKITKCDFCKKECNHKWVYTLYLAEKYHAGNVKQEGTFDICRDCAEKILAKLNTNAKWSN